MNLPRHIVLRLRAIFGRRILDDDMQAEMRAGWTHSPATGNGNGNGNV